MPTNNAIDLSSQGVAYYNGTGTFSGVDGSTSGFALTSNGTGTAPSFQTAPSGSSFMGYLNVGTTGGNPADSTTYYFAPVQFVFTASTTAGEFIGRYYIPKAITLNTVYGSVRVSGTLGSAENCTLFIRKNNTTNTNITTTLQLTALENIFSNTSLGLSLSAGDFINFAFTGPAWVTNPTNVRLALTFST